MTTNTNAAQAGAESYQLPSSDDLLRIARQCAAATDEMHGYLPITSDALETWKPHRWVIDAMKQTIVESVAMRAQAAPDHIADAGKMVDAAPAAAPVALPEADATTTEMDEFGPCFGWLKNWADYPVGTNFYAEKTVRALLAQATAAPADTFQQRVQPWMMACFGPAISADVAERNHRFLEEALELVQACGCTKSEAHQLVDYVFGRPVGDKQQEVGGVMVTLAALCLAQGLDMHSAGDIELARIWTKVEAIRAKQATKPKHSPLPMAAPAAVAGPMRDEIQRLAQFADTATRMMNPRDVRNNMETLAEELTRMLAATPAAPAAPAAYALNIDAAAKKLAESFDYPWEHMPAQGREDMRQKARDVIAAAQAAGKGVE